MITRMICAVLIGSAIRAEQSRWSSCWSGASSLPRSRRLRATLWSPAFWLAGAIRCNSSRPRDAHSRAFRDKREAARSGKQPLKELRVW